MYDICRRKFGTMLGKWINHSIERISYRSVCENTRVNVECPMTADTIGFRRISYFEFDHSVGEEKQLELKESFAQIKNSYPSLPVPRILLPRNCTITDRIRIPILAYINLLFLAALLSAMRKNKVSMIRKFNLRGHIN